MPQNQHTARAVHNPCTPELKTSPHSHSAITSFQFSPPKSYEFHCSYPNFAHHMPSVNSRNFTAESGESQPAPPKTNPKLLCMVLKFIIMAIVISLFFLFLGVAAIILLYLCVAGGALRLRLQPNTSSGLSPQDLKTLPQFRFSESDPEKECVVCLERMRQGQWCRKLVGCTHVFHRRCVGMWLVKVAACPICRARVGFDSSATVADHSMHLWAIARNSEFRVR